MHNHVWRDTVLPTPKTSKEELLTSILKCGKTGFWLKGREITFGKELEREGKVELCCNGEAATANNLTRRGNRLNKSTKSFKYDSRGYER